MKIKRGLRCCAVLSMVSVVLGIAGFVGSYVARNIEGANAQGNDGNQSDYFSWRGGMEDYSAILGEIEEEPAFQYSDIEAPVIEGAGNLPAKYDLRDEYAVRQKNQNSEGMCWLYSSVTALEYSIAKKYENYEVSVKHLDYMTIDGKYVYKQADKTNPYFDRYLDGGGYHRWSLGTSGASSELIYSMLNPLAIVSENDFTNVLKNNDNRLSSINRYEDIWSLANRDSILKNNDEGYPSYTEKQDYYKVNDASKVKYIVTSAGLSSGYAFNESRSTDGNVVKGVKDIISNYGALKVSTFGTSDRFDNCSDKKVENGRTLYTFIVDNKVDESSGVECTANHGMTIVGWDDNWEYSYNGVTKRGAFILQNSWGENENDKMKWHLGYISALPSWMYFDSVERYDDYDHYYGVEDYKKQTINPAGDEYVFEFSLDNNEEIEALVFSELYGDYTYDVYVSDTGRASDFRKDGGFTSKFGITKYEFNNKYEITGNYAIKMKRTNGSEISNDERARGTINVLSDKVWALKIAGNNSENTRLTCRVKNGSCSVVLPSPMRSGYHLIGYANSANAIAPDYHAGDTVVLSGNKTIYAVWAVDYGYIAENYNIITEGNRNYMDLTDFRYNIGEFDKIFSDDGVNIFTLEVDTNIVDGNAFLYTGGKTKLYKNNNLQTTYTNIIRGDTNGDGIIDIRDYIEIKKDIMDKTKLQNEYKLAGDVNENDKVDIQDYIEIKKKIMSEI